jgi:thiamine-monophosphate kinase
MDVARIGEFGLLELIAGLIKTKNVITSPFAQNLIAGIGDDAAVWKCSGAIQFTTTDCLTENIHFNTRYTGWEDLGYKSMAINLSDIAAMGGDPLYALISLSIPGSMEIENIESLYGGMIASANKYNVQIVGGNISASEAIIINVTVQGHSETRAFLSRSAAKPGDKIAITGYTGLSAAGLKLLKNGTVSDPETLKTLTNAHLKPEPRIAEGKTLVKFGVKTAIDISDGLISDLRHICEASGVSAIISKDTVPIHPALAKFFPTECEQLALSGGEDYELLFTADSSVINKLKEEIEIPVTIIGEIKEGPSTKITVVDKSGKEQAVSHTGWDHFKL